MVTRTKNISTKDDMFGVWGEKTAIKSPLPPEIKNIQAEQMVNSIRLEVEKQIKLEQEKAELLIKEEKEKLRLQHEIEIQKEKEKLEKERLESIQREKEENAAITERNKRIDDKKQLLKEINKKEPKTPKGKFTFSAILLVINQPTTLGHIYSQDVANNILKRFKEGTHVIVQEMNDVERKVKKIALAEPWTERTMAIVTSGQMVGNNLIFHAECKSNKFGKKLEGIINSVGIENIEFFPIGYGTTNDRNVINSNYKLNYIGLEEKSK